MATRNFPNWLKAYVAFTADSESPDDFHFWTGVATVAGALRRRVWIDMRKFQWTPNFYIILVGPPGIATKSTSIRTGIRMLEQVPGIHFGPPSITWQKLADVLASSVEHMKLVLPTGEEVFYPMSCLTISVSELGTFLKIDDTSLVDVLVDLWDGQLSTFGHSTKTSGSVEIKNPWLNIIGCTTPAWLKANFPEHLIGGGLTSRIVFVYGEKKRKLVAYPDEVMPDADYHEMERKLVEDLKQIALMQGPMILTPEARAWGHAWYAKHWTAPRANHMASDRYQGYLSRKQTHIHKIAIILCAARSNSMFIHDTDLHEASLLLESAEPHMLKVFESIGVVDESRRANELEKFVRAHGWLSADQLYTFVRNIMTQKDYEEALKSAVRAGTFKVEVRNGVRGVRPPNPGE
jgi:hypothetical protein